MKKLVPFIIILLVLAAPVAAYIVVPVEDGPIPVWGNWTWGGIPPDAQMARGVAPVYLSALTWEETSEGFICQGILRVIGRGEIGAVMFNTTEEMLPVLERWKRGDAVILPAFPR